MKLLDIFESQGNSSVTQLNSSAELQDACDLINAGGQLSWTLTPHRLSDKLGSDGAIFGLYSDGEIIGTIGLKHSYIQGHSVAEVGYLFVLPEQRNFQNFMKLYAAAANYAPKYDFVYATTNTTNTTINRLLEHNDKMEFAFTAKSPFSNNMLNYWVSKNTSINGEEAKEILQREFGGQQVNEDSASGKIALVNVNRAPEKFQSNIHALVKRSNKLEINDTPSPNQIKIVFGRNQSLPSETNTVFVGNKFYNKEQQYQILKNTVPMLPTFSDPSKISGEYIAKQKVGHKQQGQMINQMPDNAEDYVFQKKIDIESEYRVVIYYMNGKYHVSGVYKKVGSNFSISSITSGPIYETCVDVAEKACNKLGYGTSGVDIAVTTSEISESVGAIASKFGKMVGKMSSSSVKGNVVFLEANTLPSMSNPMILHDFLNSIKMNSH